MCHELIFKNHIRGKFAGKFCNGWRVDVLSEELACRRLTLLMCDFCTQLPTIVLHMMHHCSSTELNTLSNIELNTKASQCTFLASVSVRAACLYEECLNSFSGSVDCS